MSGNWFSPRWFAPRWMLVVLYAAVVCLIPIWLPVRVARKVWNAHKRRNLKKAKDAVRKNEVPSPRV